MSTLYPVAVDDGVTLPDPTSGSYQNSPTHSVLHGNENAALKALETKLGTGASTPGNNTFLVGNGVGSSAYVTASAARTAMGLGSLATQSNVSLTADVTGTLPITNGGTGAATLPSGLLKGAGTGAIVAATAGSDYAGIATAQTLTGTLVQPRTVSSTGGSITPTASLYDMGIFALLTGALTINSPGAGVEGQRQLYRIKDDGTQRALTWNAIFRAVGVTIPTTTTTGKWTYVLSAYNATDSTWDVISVAVQA